MAHVHVILADRSLGVSVQQLVGEVWAGARARQLTGAEQQERGASWSGERPCFEELFEAGALQGGRPSCQPDLAYHVFGGVGNGRCVLEAG